MGGLFILSITHSSSFLKTGVSHRQDSGTYQTSISCARRERRRLGLFQTGNYTRMSTDSDVCVCVGGVGAGRAFTACGQTETAPINTHPPLLVQYRRGTNGAAFKTGCRSSQARRKLREDRPTPPTPPPPPLQPLHDPLWPSGKHHSVCLHALPSDV